MHDAQCTRNWSCGIECDERWPPIQCTMILCVRRANARRVFALALRVRFNIWPLGITGYRQCQFTVITRLQQTCKRQEPQKRRQCLRRRVAMHPVGLLLQLKLIYERVPGARQATRVHSTYGVQFPNFINQFGNGQRCTTHRTKPHRTRVTLGGWNRRNYRRRAVGIALADADTDTKKQGTISSNYPRGFHWVNSLVLVLLWPVQYKSTT